MRQMTFVNKLAASIARRLDPESKRLVRNSSWIFISNAVSTILGFLRSVLIARGLGLDHYGTFVILAAFVDTTGQFFNLNPFTPTVKFGADYVADNRRDKLAGLIKAICLVSAVLYALAIITTYVLAHFSADTLQKAPGAMYFIVGYAIASNLSVFQGMGIAALRLFDRFRINSFVRMGADLLEFVCLLLVLFFFPHQLIPFFAVYVFARIASSLLVMYAAYREVHDEIGKHLDAPMASVREDQNQIIRFSLSNSASRTLMTLLYNADVLLIGLWAGEQQAGLYTIAKKLAHTILRLTDPFMHSIFPQLAQLTSEKRFGDIQSLLWRSTMTLAIPCVVFVLTGFIIRDWLLHTVYGPDYVEAAWPFVIQTVIAAIGAITFWSLPLIQSYGLMGKRFMILAAGIVIGIVAAWLWVPTHGAVGGSLASLAAKSFVTAATIAVLFMHANHAQPLAAEPAT